MRTPRNSLIHTLQSRWQAEASLSASISPAVVAALVCLGLGLGHPSVHATEVEVNSIAEEQRLMDEAPVKVPPSPDDRPTVTPAQEPRQDKAPAPVAKPAPSTSSATSSSDAATPELPLKDSQLPKAKSVDLAKPITNEELQVSPAKPSSTNEEKRKPDGAPEPSTAVPKGQPQPPATSAKEPAKDTDTELLQDRGAGSSAPEPAPVAPPAPKAQDVPSAAPQQKTDEADAIDAPKTGSEGNGSTAPEEAPAVLLPELEPQQPAPSQPVQPESVQPHSAPLQPEQPEPAPPQPVQPKSLTILGTEVLPSTSTRLAWSPSQSFEGLSMPTPVLVVNGAKDGPTVCLTAAIHGDELNGIEVVRRVLYGLNPKELTGAVIGVPIVNLQGFRRGSRYLTDRRDLNRYFPGNPEGSSGARIAHSFFNSVISHCNVLVDLHTGSFDRINLPQVRADLRDPGSARLTQNFGATVVLHSTGAEGTLRRAATEYGIPAVTLEAGGPMRLEEASVSHGVAAIRTLLNSMGMIKKFSFWGKPEPVYYQSSWIRVNHGGILFSNVDLGQKVKSGDVLGTVTDPITNVRHSIISSHDGRVIGMALNQVMLPGYAAYHIGIAAKDEINALPTDDALLLNDVDLSLSDAELSELTARVIN